MTNDVVFRPFLDTDAPALDSLLDTAADSLWVAQGHTLHGSPRAGARWRRTVVGVVNDVLVGAGSVASNRVHPGRQSAAIEVRSDRRRRGIGTRLLAELAAIAPDDLPMAGKVRPDSPAAHFVDAVGGRNYQRCRGEVVDPRESAITAWCGQGSAAQERAAPGMRVGPLSALARDRWPAIFAEQYLWVHEDWSPVGSPSALLGVATEEVADADPELSTGVWSADRLAAVVWAFRIGDDAVDVVAETVRRNESDGAAGLRAAVARTLGVAASAGISRLEFDGHLTDPHLAPILRQLPVSETNPLDLVEIRPTGPG